MYAVSPPTRVACVKSPCRQSPGAGRPHDENHPEVRWLMPRPSSVLRAGSPRPGKPATRSSWSSRPWVIPPTTSWTWPSRCRRSPPRASSTCCSPPVSVSRPPCSPWPCPTSASRRAATPVRRPGSSRRPPTATPTSSTSPPAASSPPWPAGTSSSSRDSKGSRRPPRT